jgi:hypothetical protein
LEVKEKEALDLKKRITDINVALSSEGIEVLKQQLADTCKQITELRIALVAHRTRQELARYDFLIDPKDTLRELEAVIIIGRTEPQSVLGLYNNKLSRKEVAEHVECLAKKHSNTSCGLSVMALVAIKKAGEALDELFAVEERCWKLNDELGPMKNPLKSAPDDHRAY